MISHLIITACLQPHLLSIAMPSSRVAVLSSNRVASMAHIMQCDISIGQGQIVDK